MKNSPVYLSVWAPEVHTCLFSKAGNDSQNLCLTWLSNSCLCAQLYRIEFTMVAPSTVTTLIQPLFLRWQGVFYHSNLNSLIIELIAYLKCSSSTLTFSYFCINPERIILMCQLSHILTTCTGVKKEFVKLTGWFYCV